MNEPGFVVTRRAGMIEQRLRQWAWSLIYKYDPESWGMRWYR